MKIVHVTSYPVAKSAGVREVVLGLARAQHDAGANVAVLGLNHPDWPQEKNEWGEVLTQVVPVVWSERFGYAPQMTDALIQLLPDVVHLHGLWMHHGRSVLQWHQKTGKPYVVSPHGMLSDVALSYGRRKKKLVSWWFQDQVFHHAAAIHVTSTNEAAEVQKYGIITPTILVPNGINEMRPPEGQNRHTILSLGRIHKKKALGDLIDAWKYLEEDFPEWSLHIVGPDEGGELARLQKRVATTGMRRVSFSGPVYGNAKLSLMESAGVFALPTLSENFALTVAESLMLEVPVVSSYGAPWAGLETHGCGYWVPNGAPAMAEGLKRILSLKDEERKEMGKRGRAWMLKEFTWPNIANTFLEKYEVIIKQTPQSFSNNPTA
ncbi:glycosyltransferase [Celeribacter halophilus]|uniref:glycosyltransferase n=1 Tax=Celeribacter halophilus TaxID=576117 RepID=UPI003A945C34